MSHCADDAAREIADRHYNRQKVGSLRFVPPGRCVVFEATDGGALWATSWPYAEFVRHAWAGAWVNSLFRRETTPMLASDMIREAVAATRAHYEPKNGLPSLGIVTFVDASKTRRKRDPGRCYRKAGFNHVGFTKGGLWAFQMLPEDMPDAEYAVGAQRRIA